MCTWILVKCPQNPECTFRPLDSSGMSPQTPHHMQTSNPTCRLRRFRIVIGLDFTCFLARRLHKRIMFTHCCNTVQYANGIGYLSCFTFFYTFNCRLLSQYARVRCGLTCNNVIAVFFLHLWIISKSICIIGIEMEYGVICLSTPLILNIILLMEAQCKCIMHDSKDINNNSRA